MLVWQKKRLGVPDPAKLKGSHPLRLIFVTYNVAYWILIVLPFTPIMSYRTGFILVFGVIVFRAVATLYRVNALTLEQSERFPLRIP